MQLAEINIPWFLIVGTTGMLLMVLTIIFFVITHQRKVIKYQLELKKVAEEQQKKLTQAAVQSEEMERKRISAELHDEVGALLSTVKLYLNQIQPANLNEQAKVEILNDCKQLLNDTVQTVRNLSANLQPASIKDFGLLSTFQHFCDKLNHSPDLQISFTVQGKIDRFQTEDELAVFRILQELTNNILKHAKPGHIQFSFFRKNDILHIFIEHSGNGLSQQEFEQKLYSMQGLGLKNIQNRINILRGTIRFEKNNNSMDSISLQIPMTN
ncbi:MAG TPA: histidine kinase [Chitinophagaceae bacterium]|jgi:signal transduction histidine kinase